MAGFDINGRRIGPDEPPYVICEVSANHNGSLERALALIDAAAQTGADAVKIQTYTPDTITIACERPEFRISGGLWNGRSLHELYQEAHTPYEWHPALFARALARGVTLFSTPFDDTAVDLLEGLGAPAYKIASFELVDLPLIARVARTGKPMILSTGMAQHHEIEEAVGTARAQGARDIALLHCVSAYPAEIGEANVATVPHLAATFGCVAGLSDHTRGAVAAVASIVLGGCIVEKHFTLSRADGGPDAAFSLEPDEFKALVEACRDARRAVGVARRGPLAGEGVNTALRRSLYAVRDIARGAAIVGADVRSIRPGLGLAPKHLPDVIGRVARRAIARGEPMRWDLFDGPPQLMGEIDV